MAVVMCYMMLQLWDNFHGADVGSFSAQLTTGRPVSVWSQVIPPCRKVKHTLRHFSAYCITASLFKISHIQRVGRWRGRAFEAADRVACAPLVGLQLLSCSVFSQCVSLFPYKHPSGSTLLTRGNRHCNIIQRLAPYTDRHGSPPYRSN